VFWTVLAIVLAILIALALFLLILPLNVRLFTDKDGKVKIVLGVLFLRFRLDKDKKSDKSNKDKQLNAAGRLKEVKEDFGKKPLSETVKNLTHILWDILKQIKDIASKSVIKRFNVKIIAASKDAAAAAIEYGAACAVIYPLVGYLSTAFKVKDGAEKIELGCKYDDENFEFALDILVSLRVMYIVKTLFYLIKREVQK
jgi:hypothetical protein